MVVIEDLISTVDLSWIAVAAAKREGGERPWCGSYLHLLEADKEI